MKPARLFVILAFLTASALAIVNFRVSSVRAAYRIQKIHDQEWAVRRESIRLKAEIARLSAPQLIDDLAKKNPQQEQPLGNDRETY